MKCPFCDGENTFVYGGRESAFGFYERYRKCADCEYKFKTIEKYDFVSIRAQKGVEKWK